MKLEPVKKNNNVASITPYKPKLIEVSIFPPSWDSAIKELTTTNWENKRYIRNIYKYQDDFWEYMKENNIIPSVIVEETEKEVHKSEDKLIHFN